MWLKKVPYRLWLLGGGWWCSVNECAAEERWSAVATSAQLIPWSAVHPSPSSCGCCCLHIELLAPPPTGPLSGPGLSCRCAAGPSVAAVMRSAGVEKKANAPSLPRWVLEERGRWLKTDVPCCFILRVTGFGPPESLREQTLTPKLEIFDKISNFQTGNDRNLLRYRRAVLGDTYLEHETFSNQPHMTAFHINPIKTYVCCICHGMQHTAVVKSSFSALHVDTCHRL